MKSYWLNFLLSFSVLTVVLPGFAGGEIPWPLSNQFTVTETNSRGLWYVGTPTGRRYYNVELVDRVYGASWMRVSEIDARTLEVLAYGEGYHLEPIGSGYAGGEGVVKDLGRYVYMFANAVGSDEPSLLRLVELNLNWGRALGFSMYDSMAKESGNHRVGYRMFPKPLECEWVLDGRLQCDVSRLEMLRMELDL